MIGKMKDKPEYVYQVLLVTKMRNTAYSSEEVGLTLDLELAKKRLKEVWDDETRCYAKQIELEGYEKCVTETPEKCQILFKNLSEGYFEEDLYQEVFIMRMEIK